MYDPILNDLRRGAVADALAAAEALAAERPDDGLLAEEGSASAASRCLPN